FRPHFRPSEGTLILRSAKGLREIGARGFEPPTSRSRSGSETNPGLSGTLELHTCYTTSHEFASSCGRLRRVAKTCGIPHFSEVARKLCGRFRRENGRLETAGSRGNRWWDRAASGSCGCRLMRFALTTFHDAVS